jgi:vacuolar-type H+-ATPase subunit H
MESILQDIIQSEEEALKLEEAARQQSLDILTEARKKAEEILEKSLIEGEALVDELLQKARIEASDERRLQPNSELNEVQQKRSREKLDAAADFIVGRVVNKPWQW